MTRNVLTLTDVIKTFAVRDPNRVLRRRRLRAVDGVSLQLAEGETLGLVGESGCGKSTLGRVAVRLLMPDAGTITLLGEDITKIKGEALRRARRNMQMVFQDPYSSLDPSKTIGESVTEPLRVHDGVRGAERRREAARLLEQVGLGAHFIDRYPAELSGGQRQRAAIARALALRPSLVIADEPVSALDVSIQADIVRLFRDLQADLGVSYVFVSHDLAVVRQISDRVAVMYLGRIVEIGSTADIYVAPQHPYTRFLLSAVPDPTPWRRRTRIRLDADLPDPAEERTGCNFASRCPLAEDTCREQEPTLREIGPSHHVACHLAEQGLPSTSPALP
jgi:oligopeptide/dipeptide ABC transporter ATP-binding protein